jgi:hypothetical protein
MQVLEGWQFAWCPWVCLGVGFRSLGSCEWELGFYLPFVHIAYIRRSK